MKKLLGAAAALCLRALPAGAVVTATWSVETYQQFDAGDATNAFITSAGELRPGWDTSAPRSRATPCGPRCTCRTAACIARLRRRRRDL